jgi:hypothetical protein
MNHGSKTIEGKGHSENAEKLEAAKITRNGRSTAY